MILKRYASLPKEIQQSLHASWKEGIFGNLMIIIVDYYLIPFGLFLGATPQEIGFLVALPYLLGSISQLFAVRSVKLAGSRRSFLIYGTTAQALFLVPMAVLAVVTFQARIQVLILLTTLFRVLGNLIGTAWGSLMSDYLTPDERGRYLGWRAQIIGLVGLAGMILAGLLLFGAKKYWSPAAGFFLLFACAALCRVQSANLFRKMVEIPHEPKSGTDFTFLMFVRQFRESNFVKFVLYTASITFATQLAAPYISVHMLKNLNLDYMRYMTIHLASILSGLISFPIWGNHADKVGNAKVLKTTSWLIPAIPFLWTLSGNFYYLIGVELFSGFIWGGFNLCAANFVFDAVSPQKRVRCFGYFNLINGIAIFAGAALGGFLAENLPVFLGYRLCSLFLLSALLRLTAHFLLSGRFREVREHVEPIKSHELFFSVLGLRSMAGRNREWHILPFLKRPSE